MRTVIGAKKNAFTVCSKWPKVYHAKFETKMFIQVQDTAVSIMRWGNPDSYVGSPSNSLINVKLQMASTNSELASLANYYTCSGNYFKM